ncbi:hypothetical protein ACFE04_011014 [Oxalis oulophora]
MMIPLIDLSKPDSKHMIVKACEELGFFKVVNHGISMEFISKLESEANNFFSLPLADKQRVQQTPLGYGNKSIGHSGDFGWVEYLLLTTNPDSNFQRFQSDFRETFRVALNEYIVAVKRMACEILEIMADGLKIQQRNVFSKLLMDEQSDSVFRLNHYPPRVPNNNDDQKVKNNNLIGFGEHTDPQIISVLRSNNASGLQISLRDGSWISVPPDHTSFFINVGDSLQVMTNGRFQSVKHRVLSNSLNSRLSMIYFGGPPLSEKIAPLASLMEGEQKSLYREFTWFEYKKSVYNSRDDDDDNNDDDEDDDEDTGAQIAPIIKLEEVAVSTGEENEDALLDLLTLPRRSIKVRHSLINISVRLIGGGN